MGRVYDLFRYASNPVAALVELGYVFDLSEAADNTTVTGPTSYANTTPTLLARVTAGSGLTLVPLYLSLGQTGSVAGGAISVVMSVDNANRYTSGGTEVKYQNGSIGLRGAYGHTPPTGFNAYSVTGSAITATNAEGVRIWGVTVGQDVSPAEGVSNELVWTPPAGPHYLTSTATLGATWIVNTNAGTTGPTWFWSARVAVFPTTEL